jgi:hypothetical protein
MRWWEMGRRKISLMKALTELLLLQGDDLGDNPRLRHFGGEMCDVELAISRRTEREILRILARRAEPRRFVAFVYIPRMRQAYGPRPVRGWTRDHLVETCGYTELSGKWLQGSGNVVAQPMPRGGVRLMAKCPLCQRCRRKLYIGPGGVRCRKCLGLRYTSQYGYRQRRSITAAQEHAWTQRYLDACELANQRIELATAEAELRWITSCLGMLAEGRSKEPDALDAAIVDVLTEGRSRVLDEMREACIVELRQRRAELQDEIARRKVA